MKSQQARFAGASSARLFVEDGAIVKLLRLFVFISLLIATSMLSAWNISAQAPPPTPVGPLKSDEPAPRKPSEIERLAPGEFGVDSKVGWQQTSLSLQQGDKFQIKYISGTWTVDYRSFTYVGPEGYTPKEDRLIFQGCKLNSSWVYARLVGKVGNGAIFPIDRGGSFKANANGDLSLRIHDVDACLVDNDGSIIVDVRRGEKQVSSRQVVFTRPTVETITNSFSSDHPGTDIQSPNRPPTNNNRCLAEAGSVDTDGNSITHGDYNHDGRCDDWRGARVHTAAPGLVTAAGVENFGSQGRPHVVRIFHGTLPDGRTIETRYLHLGTKVRIGWDDTAGDPRTSYITVVANQCVGDGEQIGDQGYSGWTTATHLHYEVLIGGQRVDPEQWGINTPRRIDLTPPSQCPLP